ncbi:polymer-forming cytoskeletal protein [Kiloniella laminariae]|uniref:Polymer-forming cytoskeletal protein n=1 Tax=Kiloniella laminariae TaxID=454162 RepID=A0ABT4LGH7_9PROT|nr:polymer-forming cytoskeletal protein [Kiloniella laminariae]MCZ4280194.1 polymer-forming cytoskeletal protein [Kiloniella laminariae]
MFSKSSKANVKTGKADSSKRLETSGIPSILSPDLNLVGDLTSSGDLQIDGTVQGDIVCRFATIGEKAVVKGSVKAEEIRVCGMVQGQLNADVISLASTAKVVGDILHKSIEIEAGAHVEGQFRRVSEDTKAEDQKVTAISHQSMAQLGNSDQTKDAFVSPAKPAEVSSNSGGATGTSSFATGSNGSGTSSVKLGENAGYSGSSSSSVSSGSVSSGTEKTDDKSPEKKSSVVSSSSWGSSS